MDRSAPARTAIWAKAGAWVLYDLANTIYAASLTYIFAPFYRETYGHRTPLGATQTVSMVLAGLAVPVLGALADRTGRARLYLTWSTLLCIAAFILMGLVRLEPGLLAAVFAANVAYQTALVFYNALLPSAAGPNTGLVSGLGVALGYFGNIVTLMLFIPLGNWLGTQRSLVAFALLFLLFALPCLCLVRDERQIARDRVPLKGLLSDAWAGLLATLRSLPRDRAVLYFLLGNFLLVDTLNTAILYFADVTGEFFTPVLDSGQLTLFGVAFRPEPAGGGIRPFIQVVGMVLTTAAIIFGVVIGAWANRGSGLRPLRFSGWCLVVALAGGAVFGGRHATGYVLTMAVVGAIGLAGIWTAGRKVLLVLAPPEKVGEYFGLYGITTKLSVIGSTVFGLLSDLFGLRVAICSQAGFLIAGLAFLYLVRIPKDRLAAINIGHHLPDPAAS